MRDSFLLQLKKLTTALQGHSKTEHHRANSRPELMKNKVQQLDQSCMTMLSNQTSTLLGQTQHRHNFVR
jgi:hypothetical protein